MSLVILGCQTHVQQTPVLAVPLLWYNTYYATDGSHFFYYPGTNSSNFSVVLNETLDVDFYRAVSIPGQPDIATFSVVSGELVKDATDVYYPGKNFNHPPNEGSYPLVWLRLGADPNTFIVLDRNFARDEHKIYFFPSFYSRHNQPVTYLDIADAATFTVLTDPSIAPGYVAQDKNGRYRLERGAMLEELHYYRYNVTNETASNTSTVK